MCTQRSIAAALVLAACTATAGWTRPITDSTVKVHVVDDNGAALPGVTVAVKTKGCHCNDCSDPQACDCCVDQVQVTDAGGYIEILVPAGTYSLRASLQGFQTAEEQVTVGPGLSSNITIKMATRMDGAGALQESQEPCQCRSRSFPIAP